MRLIDYGEHAILAEVDDASLVPRLRAALADRPGVVDAVAGARTVLAVVETGARAEVRRFLDAGEFGDRSSSGPARTVTVPVVYDGEDLDAVADLAAMSREEVIVAHSGGAYVVRFCGFSPGFAYLDGLDERLQLPRRDEPRTVVPAGSVGVAGEFTGIYPRRSPGGWRLLGRTDLTLWDPGRAEPALLTPGTRVRFERR